MARLTAQAFMLPSILRRVLRVALPVALLSTLGACADADRVGPVCGRPQIVGLVSERLRRAGVPPLLEAESIGQAPGPQPDIVLCSVWVRQDRYDTPKRGEVPADHLVAYQYRLQLRRNVAFLMPDPAFRPLVQ